MLKHINREQCHNIENRLWWACQHIKDTYLVAKLRPRDYTRPFEFVNPACQTSRQRKTMNVSQSVIKIVVLNSFIPCFKSHFNSVAHVEMFGVFFTIIIYFPLTFKHLVSYLSHEYIVSFYEVAEAKTLHPSAAAAWSPFCHVGPIAAHQSEGWPTSAVYHIEVLNHPCCCCCHRLEQNTMESNPVANHVLLICTEMMMSNPEPFLGAPTWYWLTDRRTASQPARDVLRRTSLFHYFWLVVIWWWFFGRRSSEEAIVSRSPCSSWDGPRWSRLI